jgi:hypothetical protein
VVVLPGFLGSSVVDERSVQFVLEGQTATVSSHDPTFNEIKRCAISVTKWDLEERCEFQNRHLSSSNGKEIDELARVANDAAVLALERSMECFRRFP